MREVQSLVYCVAPVHPLEDDATEAIVLLQSQAKVRIRVN